MPLKILIVPDKFKGTLTANAAAEAIARGWHNARPRDDLELLPMSDGGDGFGEVMRCLLGAQTLSVRTVDAAHRPVQADWAWEPKTKTALIESARVIGLARLSPGEFHPSALDTFGLGAILRAAFAKGAKRCIVGVGGSATNDGGLGLARALDWRFLNQSGKLIKHWTDLRNLSDLKLPQSALSFRELIVAVDVQNPLLGIRGATRVYGPQKGLRPDELERDELCLRRLAIVCRKTYGKDFARMPGAGAAGGLGFGLLAFLGARMEPGFDLFAHCARLDRRLRSADLVITGEGRLDRSTLMGKGVGQIAQRCHELGIPCIGLAGGVEEHPRVNRGFTRLCAMTQLASPVAAKSKPVFWLGRLAELCARDFRTCVGLQ